MPYCDDNVVDEGDMRAGNGQPKIIDHRINDDGELDGGRQPVECG